MGWCLSNMVGGAVSPIQTAAVCSRALFWLKNNFCLKQRRSVFDDDQVPLNSGMTKAKLVPRQLGWNFVPPFALRISIK